MSVLRSDATHYLLGTNQSNVRTCFLDAGQTRIDCTQLNGTLPSNVIPVSFAADGTRAFVVGARQTGQEMDGEGIYKVDSASVTAAYTRALDPNLHFDALGGGPTRQGVALSSTYGYFTTTTRLYAFPVLGGSANVVVDKLNHATEVQTDESFVYFIEYADGVQPGGLYRMPLK